METRVSLEKQFADLGISVNDDILDKCLELCILNDIGEEELVETWMAYSISNLDGAEPTLETLSQLEKKELKKRDRLISSVPCGPSLTVYNSVSTNCNVNNDDVINQFFTSPKSRQVHDEPARNSPQTVFSPASYSPVVTTALKRRTTRASKGQTLCSFGDQSSDAQSWRGNRCSDSINLSCCTAQPTDGQWLYMSEQLREKANILDERIEQLGECIAKKFSLDEPEHIVCVQPDMFTCVGRVCCDTNGRLNASSVLLEGARSACSGRTVAVDLSLIAHYSLFPGQIVAIRGTNPTGEKILAKQIFSGATLPLPSQSPTFSIETDSLQLVVAAGPFTQTDSLSYQPLVDLLEYIVQHQPDVLILVGPLVDTAHPLLMESSLAETFHDYYNKLVNMVMKSLQATATQVVLVGSGRDATSPPVYPTPRLVLRKPLPRLTTVGDPCLLNINGLVVGLSATDSLMHLGQEEISWPHGLGDRLGRLASHVLQQQTFYPLYPSRPDVNIDLGLWEEYGCLSMTPHVLVVPSDLRFFIKNIEGCVVINPERLAKGFIDGSFARVAIRPPSDGEQWLPHTHISAQIVKL